MGAAGGHEDRAVAVSYIVLLHGLVVRIQIRATRACISRT